jgi:hypothetical protein
VLDGKSYTPYDSAGERGVVGGVVAALRLVTAKFGSSEAVLNCACGAMVLVIGCSDATININNTSNNQLGHTQHHKHIDKHTTHTYLSSPTIITPMRHWKSATSP